MQGNLTYKIPGEEERNMVNGKQKQNKHKRLNKKNKKRRSCCCLDGKASTTMGFTKKEYRNFKSEHFVEKYVRQNQTKPPHHIIK